MSLNRFLSSFLSLSQSGYDPKTGEGIVTIVPAGMNKMKEIDFPAAILQRDGPKAFSGRKMFIDHPAFFSDRSARDHVAQMSKAYFDDESQSLKAGFKIFDSTWKTKIDDYAAAGLLDQVALSLYAKARIEPVLKKKKNVTTKKYSSQSEDEEVSHYVVTEFQNHPGNSLDFVSHGATAAGIDTYQQAMILNPNDAVLMQSLKRSRPDLAEFISQSRKEDDDMDKDELIKQLQQELKELKESAEGKEAAESVKTLQAEITALKTSLATADGAVKKAAFDTALEAALTKSSLHDATKNRVKAMFTNETDIEKISDVVKQEEQYLKELGVTGKPLVQRSPSAPSRDLGKSSPLASPGADQSDDPLAFASNFSLDDLGEDGPSDAQIADKARSLRQRLNLSLDEAHRQALRYFGVQKAAV